MSRKRGLTEGEKLLWRNAMRDVRPNMAEAVKVPKPPPPADGAARAHLPKPEPVPLTARDFPRRDPQKPFPAPDLTAVDGSKARRIKRGEEEIEARLDLHGHTLERAHAELARFLAQCQRAGLRTVLVITGKSGKLASEAPRWLGEAVNRPRVVAFHPARPQHGGAGALYVVIRRLRGEAP